MGIEIKNAVQEILQREITKKITGGDTQGSEKINVNQILNFVNKNNPA